MILIVLVCAGTRGFKLEHYANKITIMYEIPTFSLVGTFFKEGGRGSRKFRPEAEILGIFSIEVAPYAIYVFAVDDGHSSLSILSESNS